ncbi:MAG: guanylate kinase [Rhodospirillaceae bacterium]|nr:guanylate kinase [Rhodospirillaceae bacterium]
MSPADIRRRGVMLVLSSPSGAGKSSIARRLLKEDNNLWMSVSVTTRPPRPGEVEGKDYFFVDDARYTGMVAENELLEHATVFGYSYGTPRKPVDDSLNAGRDVLFDVDWQGAQQLSQSAPNAHPVTVFLLPPSMAELHERLKRRAQDSAEVVARRMARAANEISHWAEYDYVLVNDDLDACVDKVRAILRVERMRRFYQVGLSEYVSRLLAV